MDEQSLPSHPHLICGIKKYPECVVILFLSAKDDNIEEEDVIGLTANGRKGGPPSWGDD